MLQYRIEHPTYGDIGTFTNTIIKDGARTDVETAVRVTVKILGATMYRESSDRFERWRSDRLVFFHAITDKNDHRFEVSGEAQGDRFVVKGPDGTFVGPADIQPPNTWSATCLKGDAMLSSLSGRIFAAHVIDRGTDDVTVDGHHYRAHEYEVDTDRPHLVWFDDRGIPLQIQSVEHGDTVRLELTRYPEHADMVAAAPPR